MYFSYFNYLKKTILYLPQLKKTEMKRSLQSSLTNKKIAIGVPSANTKQIL